MIHVFSCFVGHLFPSIHNLRGRWFCIFFAPLLNKPHCYNNDDTYYIGHPCSSYHKNSSNNKTNPFPIFKLPKKKTNIQMPRTHISIKGLFTAKNLFYNLYSYSTKDGI